MDDDFGFDVANDNAEGHHAICAIVTDDGGKFFFGFTQDDEDQVEIVGRGVEISDYYLSQEEIDYIPYRLAYDGIVVADTFIKRIHEGGKAQDVDKDGIDEYVLRYNIDNSLPWAAKWRLWYGQLGLFDNRTGKIHRCDYFTRLGKKEGCSVTAREDIMDY